MWKTLLYYYSVNNYTFNNRLISTIELSTYPQYSLLYTGLERHFNMFSRLGAIVFYRSNKTLNNRVH
jgi:hypothetical protein